VLSAAGCGGGDDGSAAAVPAAATAMPAKTAAAPSGAVAARIQGFAFAPKQLKVKVGEEITWTNDDSAAHTVTAKSGASFDSGTLAQGADFTFKAAKPGTIAYFCAIHPSMTGTITVE
jgi:plastocyanin